MYVKRPSHISEISEINNLDINLLCRLCGLVQVVDKPTRGDTILDKIVTNIGDYYSKPEILTPIGLSDHNTVLWLPKICPHQRNTVQHRVVRTFRNLDKLAFGRWMVGCDWSSVSSAGSAYHMTAAFYEILSPAMDSYFRQSSLVGYSMGVQLLKHTHPSRSI